MVRFLYTCIKLLIEIYENAQERVGSTLKCYALQVCSSYNTSCATFVFAITDEIKDLKVFKNILFPKTILSLHINIISLYDVALVYYHVEV